MTTSPAPIIVQLADPDVILQNPSCSLRYIGGRLCYVNLMTTSILAYFETADSAIHESVRTFQGVLAPLRAHLAGYGLTTRLDTLITTAVYVSQRSGSDIQYRPTTYHSMLLDTDQLTPYLLALAKCVTPGSRVVELGSGLGLAALFAAKLGAHVIALEPGPTLEVCRRFAAANGLSEQVTFVASRLEDFELCANEKADVVVSEFIGSTIFNEGIIEKSKLAATKYLKPGGTLIPARIAACVHGVRSSELYQRAMKHSYEGSEVGRLLGFDLSAWDESVRLLMQTGLIHSSKHYVDLPRHSDVTVVTTVAHLFEVDLRDEVSVTQRHGTAEVHCLSDGPVDGFQVFFKAWLDSDIAISSSLSGKRLFSWPLRLVPTLSNHIMYHHGDAITIDWAYLDSYGDRDKDKMVVSVR